MFLSPEGFPIVGSAVKKGKIVISTRQLAFLPFDQITNDLIRTKDFLQAGSSMFEESPHCPTQSMFFVRHHLSLFCIIYPVAAPG